jgi:hypothetical protein
MEDQRMPPTDDAAAEIIDFLRDTHPDMIERWEADMRQLASAAGSDADPADARPDYRSNDGAAWWLHSELRACRQSIRTSPSADHDDEHARISTCEAALLLFHDHMRGGDHE